MAGRISSSIRLTPADRESPLWKMLRDDMARRLDEFRTQLEQVKLTDAETASLRGKISLLRELLSLDTASVPASAPTKAARFTSRTDFE